MLMAYIQAKFENLRTMLLGRKKVNVLIPGFEMDWLLGFMQRNKKLSARRPQPASLHSAQCFNRTLSSALVTISILLSKSILQKHKTANQLKYF